MSDDPQTAEADAGEAQPAPCPKCKEVHLAELYERDVPFLGCTECYGLFVRSEDLHEYVVRATENKVIGEAFTSLLDRFMHGKLSSSARKCPICDEPLLRGGFGESPFVIIDACKQDGIWLDKKELKKILRASRGQAAAQGLIPKFDDDDDADDDGF